MVWYIDLSKENVYFVKPLKRVVGFIFLCGYRIEEKS